MDKLKFKTLSLDSIYDVSTKKRFWNPRKWFKRKNNKVADDTTVPNDVEAKETLRSRSTSELSEPEEPPKRRSGAPMHPGLSVSHDSVFHSPDSGSDTELEGAHSSSSLSTHHNVHGGDRLQTELVERLRLRRGRGDTSEDDEGLPRSPCNSPTATEKTANKDHPTKSHSTCSEGSLISVGSSEMDEDSSGQQSHHSSKISLQDKKSSEGDLELETVQSSSYPLNHSAAHHRVSVRPSRRHGAPRRKRVQQISSTALPTTLEVNEESSIRSVTPEITIRDAVNELYTNATIVSKPPRFLTVNQLKCSSLPPGLASPNSDSSKLHRSRSNAGTKSQDEIGTLGEEDEPHDKKSDSFLGKLFPLRRSAKKKKHSKEEKGNSLISEKDKEDVIDSATIGVSSPINVVHPKPLPRSGAAARQRVLPSDIPASPELSLRHEELNLSKSSPEKSNVPTPLHLELESKLLQRMTTHSTSISPRSQPSSPKSPLKSPIMDKHFIKHSKVEIHDRKSTENVIETNKSKVVIAGLSQFQKKAMIHHSEEKDYKSLTEFSKDEGRLKPIVVKSHSFKSIKNSNHSDKNVDDPKEIHGNKTEIIKANSFESIKNLDEVAAEKQKSPKTEIVDVKVKADRKFMDSGITISGPSHKAIVSIGNTNNNADNNDMQMNISEEHKEEYKNTESKHGESKVVEVKELQVSVTKIQVKRESTHVVSKISSTVPEFMNVQLHRVEKPNNNIVLSTAFTKTEELKPRSPPIIEGNLDIIGKETEKIKSEHTSANIKAEHENTNKLENIEKLTSQSKSSELKTENSRTQIENSITKNVNSRSPNENLKPQNENLKIQNQNLKTSNENLKMQNENSRTHTEYSRTRIQNTKVHVDHPKSFIGNSRIQSNQSTRFENQDMQGETVKSHTDSSKKETSTISVRENTKMELKNDNDGVSKCETENEKVKLENGKQRLENHKQRFGNEKQRLENEKQKLETIEKLRAENENIRVQSDKYKFTSEKFKSHNEKPSVQINSTSVKPKAEADKSKVENEKSKMENEEPKRENEESRKENEKFKKENERSKMENEKLKMETEKSKMENEKLKIENEKSKIENEKLKSDYEKFKTDSERFKKESEKLKPTNQKQKSETANTKPGKMEKSISFIQKTRGDVDSIPTKIKMERSISEPESKSKLDAEKSEIHRSKSEMEKSKPEMETPKTEIDKPKIVEKVENVRKFSKEDIEIIEKDDKKNDDKKHVTTALVTITTMSAPPKAFKKPDNLPLRKSFVPINNEKLEKPVLKVKSSSLDMVEINPEKDDRSLLKPEEKNDLRPKTHSANDITDTNQVTYRRKSVVSHKKDDEPELMKVFARRSLKLKDCESEALSQQVVKMIEEEKEAAKSRDSDKENQSESSPEERKKKYDPEVTLRKPIVNNKISSSYQRAVSLNQKTNEVNTEKMQKQYSLAERPKTEWIKTQDEIITITDKGPFIEEDKPKNFNQRMAEWEKRAQSVRKTSP